MLNNTVYHFVGWNLGIEIFLKKREHQKDGLDGFFFGLGNSWFQKSPEEFRLLNITSGKFITFNYLCENSPNFLCYFWKHKSFFTKKLLCIFFSSSITYFRPSKCKFSDLPLLALKFTKFVMLFFKQKVSFPSKLGSIFSIMKDNSSVLLFCTLPNFICYWQKEPIKVQIFETFKCSGQYSPNSSCRFWNDKSIPFQILHHSSLSWHMTPL